MHSRSRDFAAASFTPCLTRRYVVRVHLGPASIRLTSITRTARCHHQEMSKSVAAPAAKTLSNFVSYSSKGRHPKSLFIQFLDIPDVVHTQGMEGHDG